MRPFVNAALLGARVARAARLNAGTYATSTTYPAAASVDFTIASSGTATITADNGESYTWMTLGVVGDFLLDVTVTSGTFTSGTTGTGISLAGGQIYNVTRSSLGTKSCTATFVIKDAVTGAPYATASITLSATVDA